LGWAKNYEEEGGFGNDDKKDLLKTDQLTLLAALGGSVLTRTCSRMAFKEAGRAMQTT
jgi:NAD(P)H-hydrate repair Nnr-like enzyme with NAD(P)H-hydrate dehydratase domain